MSVNTPGVKPFYCLFHKLNLKYSTEQNESVIKWRKVKGRISNEMCEQMAYQCDKDTGRWSQMVCCELCQQQGGWTEKKSATAGKGVKNFTT